MLKGQLLAYFPLVSVVFCELDSRNTRRVPRVLVLLPPNSFSDIIIIIIIINYSQQFAPFGTRNTAIIITSSAIYPWLVICLLQARQNITSKHRKATFYVIQAASCFVPLAAVVVSENVIIGNICGKVRKPRTEP